MKSFDSLATPAVLMLALSAAACTNSESTPEASPTNLESPSRLGEKIIKVCEYDPVTGERLAVFIDIDEYDAAIHGRNLLDCGKSEPSTDGFPTMDTCEVPRPLEELLFSGRSKRGEFEFVNVGECARIYSPDTMQTLGTIPTGESFIAVCTDVKPKSVEVVSGEVEGYVNISNNFVVTNQEPDRPKPLVPRCD